MNRTRNFFRLMVAMLAHLRSGGRHVGGGHLLHGLDGASAGALAGSPRPHETVEIVHEMFEQPITALTPRAWSKSTASDLRRVLIRTMEQHAERRFLTVPLLEAL